MYNDAYENYTELKFKNSSSYNYIVGDLLSIIGAFFYSIFAVKLEYYYNKHEKYFNILDVFGYMGLYNLLFVPVLLIFLNIFNIEKFVLPTFNQFILISINGLIATVLADTLQLTSVCYLASHIVSFGLTLTIPLSYFYDVYDNKIKFNLKIVLITLILMSAFSLILHEKLASIDNKKKKNLSKN